MFKKVNKVSCRPLLSPTTPAPPPPPPKLFFKMIIDIILFTPVIFCDVQICADAGFTTNYVEDTRFLLHNIYLDVAKVISCYRCRGSIIYMYNRIIYSPLSVCITNFIYQYIDEMQSAGLICYVYTRGIWL